jgi:hypothetical protein
VGEYWSRTITFINAPTGAGVLFKISWGDDEVEMESMADPISDVAGLKYRLQAGGETLADWVAHFAEDIGYNYLIATNFTIAYTTDSVTLTAKEKGADWNLTFNEIPGTVTTDYTLGTETLGVDAVLRDHFKVFLEIWDTATNESKFVMEMLHISDTSLGFGSCHTII